MPPEATIAPPTTPAPAPAAPAAPLAAPSSPTAAPTAAKRFDQYFEIPEKTDEPVKVESPKPEPSKPDPAKAKPDPAKPAQPEKAANLREAKDRAESEVKTLRAKVTELEARLKAPAEDPEKKKLMEERESWGKTREELENEVKFAKYERSKEYKEKYEAPFIEAYSAGRKRAEGLKIVDPDKLDRDGNVTEAGKVRQATAQDFDSLMGIVNDDEAWDFAKKTFGDKAGLVWNSREKVNELNNARAKAVEEFQKTGLEREKQQNEMTQKQTKEFEGLFQSAIKAAVENPVLKDWFTPDEGDEAGKAVLERGFKLADDAFGDTSKMTAEAKAGLYAAVRNRAAAAGLLSHRLKQSMAREKELEAKLKAYEDSEPNLDDKGGRKDSAESKPKGGMAAFEDRLNKMAGK